MSICVVGDLMLDKFSYGYVKRLNPESPAPLITITKEEYKLGGAANVASNISSLIGRVDLIGCLGKNSNLDFDENGVIFDKICNELNIALYSVKTEFPTITKQRFIEQTYHQQMLRADYEQKIILNTTQKTKILDFLNETECKFLVISDYNKGTIDFELISMLINYANQNNIKILADTKPSNINYFKGIYLLKPNFKEFCEMIGHTIPNEDSYIENFGKKLVMDMNVNLVVTRGDKGATLITKENEIFHLHTQAKQVFDVTGAGDTFIATICVGLIKGMSLIDSIKLGNKASGVVVGKVGTQTVRWDEINI